MVTVPWKTNALLLYLVATTDCITGDRELPTQQGIGGSSCGPTPSRCPGSRDPSSILQSA